MNKNRFSRPIPHPTRFAATFALLAAFALHSGCGGPPGAGGAIDAEGCPIEPEERTDYNLCRARVGECPHLGDDLIHNVCADGLPHNVAWDGKFFDNADIPISWFSNPDRGGRAGQGCDVDLAGRQFDALSWDSKKEHPAVWEIRTTSYMNQGEHQRKCKLRKQVKDFIDDCALVVACNKGYATPEARFRYAMAQSDQELFRALTDYLAQHPGELPPGGAEACFTVDAQACR